MAPNRAESYLDDALEALARHRAQRQVALDAIPAPIYLTDPDGRVTYWNRACVDFAGREPQLGRDRWCVTWELHTPNDDPLPHGDCPMAVAIREKRPVRGEVAIAMRPDGSRRAFTPYPTPLFDEEGELVGAINMLIDVTREQAATLHAQSARCRRLAEAISDQYAARILRDMADGYARNAAALRLQS
ncbi:MAG TPA: PAS domain-containing protein [Sphingomicrobium sp.]|nr:PAS domain-containing protein [Sphingomicrobium sp.]